MAIVDVDEVEGVDVAGNVTVQFPDLVDMQTSHRSWKGRATPEELGRCSQEGRRRSRRAGRPQLGVLLKQCQTLRLT